MKVFDAKPLSAKAVPPSSQSILESTSPVKTEAVPPVSRRPFCSNVQGAYPSPQQGLDFGEFTIDLVGLRFKELRDVFSSVDINQDDWIFEKSCLTGKA